MRSWFLTGIVLFVLQVATILCQIIAYGVVHSHSLSVVVQAIFHTSTVLLIASKMLTTFVYKEDIRIILNELKSMFGRQMSEKDKFKVKKCLNEYYRVVKSYFGIHIFAKIFVTVPLILYLTSGKTIFFVNSWFLFDEFRKENFPFALLWQNWNAYVLLRVFLASDSLFYAIVTVFSMEFDILKIDFMNIKIVLKSD